MFTFLQQLKTRTDARLVLGYINLRPIVYLCPVLILISLFFLSREKNVSNENDKLEECHKAIADDIHAAF